MSIKKKRARSRGSGTGSGGGQSEQPDQIQNTTSSAPRTASSATETDLGIGFRLDRRGVKKKHEKKWVPVCSWLEVLAETRDIDGKCWGRLLRIKDRDGNIHEWAMPMYLLAGDGREIREILLGLGLEIEPTRAARDALMEYIAKWRPRQKARCVAQIGWHNGVFVLPDKTIGISTAERVVLQSGIMQDHSFHCRGTLQGWKDNVARYAIGNSRLALCLSTAAAAPLLRMMGLESGGFHLQGQSSIGKSTGLEAGGSFWGGGGKRGRYSETWRTTDNGLEAVVARHNDVLLCLDEISQVDPKTASGIAYMISNESGKRRANQRGGGEPVATWKTLFLSNGEMTLGQKIEEDSKQRRTAGQAARVVDIQADAKVGHGLFEKLHGFHSGGHLSDHIRAQCAEHYGTAAREFIDRVAKNPQWVKTWIKEKSDQFMRDNCPDGVDGQVTRVAARFAHVAAAGELAIEFGIFPWPTGEAIWGAAVCFKSWLQSRGGNESFEEIEGLRQVSSFIQTHGASRFEHWDKDDRTGTIYSRIGWKRKNAQGSYDYLVTPAGFREIMKGFNSEKIAQAMARRNLLIPATDGRNSKSLTPPGYEKMRLYHIRATVLSDGAGDVDDESV